MTWAAATARPLIVGAGPVGLGAALFLAREGVLARVIEQSEQPSAHSKALAVNPRTLDLLEPTGVTQRMTELGMPIQGARFWHRGATVAELSFAGLRHRYPWMLALSQATTERLLEEALAAHGVMVERGVGLVRCAEGAGNALATLQHRTGEQETMTCPWLLATDGARSLVREQLQVPFEGTTFDRLWHLADVPLSTTLPSDRAHVFFLDEGGFLFMLRVVNGRPGQPGDPLWRVMSNLPDPLSRITQGRVTGEPVWTSSFRISHRINAAMHVGHVYFAGDAAHIHSPVGARGMNLGLEDAFVFSRLVLRGEMSSRYDRLRRPTDRLVVKRVERVSRIVRGESWISRFLRRVMLPVIVRIPPIRRLMIGIVTGLDHDVERDGRTSSG